MLLTWIDDVNMWQRILRLESGRCGQVSAIFGIAHPIDCRPNEPSVHTWNDSLSNDMKKDLLAWIYRITAVHQYLFSSSANYTTRLQMALWMQTKLMKPSCLFTVASRR